MPSSLYAFICAKTTADFVLPGYARDINDLVQRLKLFSQGLVGGQLTVGDIKFRPTQAAIPNHLLCDGTTVSYTQFPELVAFLEGEGATEATLPDLRGALTIATPTVTQTVDDSGTVSTEATTVTDAGTVGGTTGGNVTTGGRVRQNIRPDEELP